MHALDVSNFLVAPITFDKYSMRGVHLITNLLSTRHEWLGNPLRVRIVPNRIKKANTEGEQQKLVDAENRIREAFPDLARSIVPYYIRQSAIVSNEARQYGFIADQTTRNPGHLEVLVDDFHKVAIDLLNTLKRAFGDAQKDKGPSSSVIQRVFDSIFGDPMERHPRPDGSGVPGGSGQAQSPATSNGGSDGNEAKEERQGPQA
jgi:hypothetical protein